MAIQETVLLKIGEVALKSGVPIKTIRYYEELGLLKASKRTNAQFRLFKPSVVSRLAFIKRLQSLGFTLQEIGECLAVYDQGNLPCDNIQAKLEKQVDTVNQRITELILLRTELTNLLQHWSTSPEEKPGVICPNLEL
jgi:DNA-binding transcriptional MerR regulator